jgi:hypothetical protein
MTLHAEVTALRARLVEVTAERDALRAQLEGDLPEAMRWLQRKVWRQRAALDALNRRVLAQRIVLRKLDELGRSLTTDEYRAARSRIADALRRRHPRRPRQRPPPGGAGRRAVLHVGGSRHQTVRRHQAADSPRRAAPAGTAAPSTCPPPRRRPLFRSRAEPGTFGVTRDV